MYHSYIYKNNVFSLFWYHKIMAVSLDVNTVNVYLIKTYKCIWFSPVTIIIIIKEKYQCTLCTTILNVQFLQHKYSTPNNIVARKLKFRIIEQKWDGTRLRTLVFIMYDFGFHIPRGSIINLPWCLLVSRIKTMKY